MNDPAPLVDVLLRQGQAWRRGERVGVEALLVRHPHLAADDNAVLDLIYNEVVLREEAGEKPALGDYLPRFPRLAAELSVQFEVDQALTMDELAGPVRSPSQSTVFSAALSQPVPDWLHGFDLLEEVGRGAMGTVWRALQRGARRVVAVKLLALDVPAARVRTEIEAVTRLSHPNILPIFEVREDAGRTALVLEFADGGNLADKLGGKPQPPRDAARLLEVLASAMAHAHERGVVHRDLKPSNVLLAGDPETPLGQVVPRIGDFGLAKLVQSDQQLTRTNDILGTPSYMAPEQTGGQPVGPAVDIYALGAILYECLTGRPPFLGESVLDTLEQLRNQDPVPPSRLQPRTPRDLEVITLKCLHKSPARRYGSARELAADLRRFLANEAIQGRAVGAAERAWKWARRHPAAAALAGVMAAAAVLLLVAAAAVNRTLRGERDYARRLVGERDAQLELLRQEAYTSQLLRIGNLWPTEPRQGLRMLDDPRVCPPDLRCFSWGVLRALCKRYDEEWLAHDGPITALAVSPDGTLLATGTRDGRVGLFDARTRKPIATLHEHTDRVSALAFTADGATLASGGHDGLIRIWDARAGRLRDRIRPASGRVLALAFHPRDVRHLASSIAESRSAVVQLWDVTRGTVRRTLTSEAHPQGGLAISPDGNTLACADVDHVVRLYDTRTGRYSLLRKHSAPVTALAFAKEGRPLVTASLDGNVRFWYPDRLEPLTENIETGVAITSIGLPPLAQTVALASERAGEDGEGVDLHLLDVPSRRAEDPVRAHGGVGGVSYSPDGTALLTAGTDGTVKSWAHPGRRERVLMRDMAGKAGGVALSRDGGLLACVRRAASPTIDVYDLRPRRGTLDASLTGHSRPVRCLAVLDDDRTVVSSAGADRDPPQLLLWDVRSDRPLTGALHGHGDAVTAMAAGPGRRLVTAGRDGSVKVWDVASGKERLALQENVVWQAAAFAAGGKRVAAGGAGAVVVWATDGSVVLRAQTGSATCLALSPDGGCAAWATAAGDVRLAGEYGHTLATGMTAIASVAFSADGRALAVAGSGTGVKLFDVASGRERAALPGHKGGSCFAGFTADGGALLTADVGGQGRLWYSAR